MAHVLADHHLQAVGGFTPTLLHVPGHDPVPGVEHLLSTYAATGSTVLVLSAELRPDRRPSLGPSWTRRAGTGW